MNRYKVIESKRWIGPNGRTASLYGSVPYTNEADKPLWKIQVIGWTVENTVTGTIGIGRQPWATKEEAQIWIDGWEANKNAMQN